MVYYSRNRILGSPELVFQEVHRILEVSRINNARVGVTGALLFNSGCFAQVLEGPQEAVEATFERIQRDDRHGEVSLMSVGPIADRCFTNWSMAFVGASQVDADRFGGIAGESGFDPNRMTGDRVHAMLYNLTLEEEQAT
ncbi:BLUF domain-containing protein [Methylobacterium iners]|uniref:BLUF domain-containing protein n=1 Tax=Methylobacterium iners TaxID=418707 RepID=UPI0027956673|nr:BLUF domain-containing protein [Methylobacterium iners]